MTGVALNSAGLKHESHMHAEAVKLCTAGAPVARVERSSSTQEPSHHDTRSRPLFSRTMMRAPLSESPPPALPRAPSDPAPAAAAAAAPELWWCRSMTPSFVSSSSSCCAPPLCVLPTPSAKQGIGRVEWAGKDRPTRQRGTHVSAAGDGARRGQAKPTSAFALLRATGTGTPSRVTLSYGRVASVSS